MARLARIELTPAEEEKFERELSSILGFIEKLKEIDTASVLPMTGGTLLENVLRKDEVKDKNLEDKSSALINAAPEKKERWIKVRTVFE